MATRRRLHDATPEQRAQEGCLTGGRSELMLPGLAILDAVWTIWPAARLRVGDRGLREGILLSMMHGGKGGHRPQGGGHNPQNNGRRQQGRKQGGGPKPPSGEGAPA